MLSKCQLLLIIFVVGILIYNDFLDSSAETQQLKYLVSGAALLLLLCILRGHQSKVFTGMAEITKEKLFVSTVAQESRLSAMQTKIVSFSKVSPVQFAKALCDEKLRMSLRFNTSGQDKDDLNTTDFLGSNSSFMNHTADLENNRGSPLKDKKDVWGTFDHGQLNGGVYRLEQDDSVFQTLYDSDRYIIVEHSRGLSRYYVFTNASAIADEYRNSNTSSQSLYYFVHYVVPSVPQSTRVHQQVNKRSIDDDVKEFFAIKNMAHFQYQVSVKSPAYFNNRATGGMNFPGTISNIEKSFDSHIGDGERRSSMQQVFGKRLNRKSGALGIVIPN